MTHNGQPKIISQLCVVNYWLNKSNVYVKIYISTRNLTQSIFPSFLLQVYVTLQNTSNS